MTLNNQDQAVQMLGALAQGHRLTVYRLLIQHAPDGLPAGDIGEKLGVPAATLSFHLKELSHAGLVTRQQRGRQVIYAAATQAMQALIGYLTENCCRGEPCLPTAACR
ncbi:metalloregulator ArsR/SmtB family transcription factor [Oleiagrimonas sp. C23AA]|uniref:ArsR/SmtB family transcription factor n=1 Tax=Oleiagrimonas sp. C23AA TaxID=2719047 RepID=UPI0014213277|nr:metalloregulator ArsR/SmtB family transcription factor [Oleiagrimonas sp. C23AA]NII11696.1 helix-turn-helix transcriptional regulator [Oleiagrimonas sp. C23AA]